MKRFESYSISETENLATSWLKEISASAQSVRPDGAVLVGLSGHLGAGKTAFVKALAKTLAITDEVTSPTFVIMKMYPIVNPPLTMCPWKRLVHIDAYRLEDPKEIQVLQFEKLMSDPQNLILVEWPENVDLQEETMTHLLRFESKDSVYSVEISK